MTSPSLPPGALAQAHVPAAAFSEAIARMSKLGRNTPGLASFTFSPAGLHIAWMGMTALLDAPVTGEATLVVDGQVLHGLHHTGGWPDLVPIVARPTELKVAYTLIDAEQRPEPAPALLPLNTTPKDILRLHVREPPDRIAAAGLTKPVTEAMARLDRSATSAGQALAWLGITAEDVRAWALERLDGRPAVELEPKVITVETSGQVRLFEE